jgi:hypothetical protein
MDTPLILAAYAKCKEFSPNYNTKFGEAVKHLEDGLRMEKIWNQEYEDVKYWLNRVCEDVLGSLTHAYYEESLRDKYVSQGDPRWDIHYFFTPIHANGYLKKVRKAQKNFNTPVLEHMAEVLFEMAALYERVKAVRPFIVKGRKPNPNAPPPDLSHTGTCCICRRVQKLREGNVMVDHGFKISAGWGQYYGNRQGHCYGVGFNPYELSCEANKKFKKMLDGEKVNLENWMTRLQTGTEVLTRFYKEHGQHKTEKVAPGDKRYPALLSNSIEETRAHIRNTISAIMEQTRLIHGWKAVPLKHGGYNAKVLQFPKNQ